MNLRWVIPAVGAQRDGNRLNLANAGFDTITVKALPLGIAFALVFRLEFAEDEMRKGWWYPLYRRVETPSGELSELGTLAMVVDSNYQRLHSGGGQPNGQLPVPFEFEADEEGAYTITLGVGELVPSVKKPATGVIVDEYPLDMYVTLAT